MGSLAGEAADGVADEAQGGEADGGGHLADLAVLALVDLDLYPRGGNVGAVSNRRGALPGRGVVGGEARGSSKGFSSFVRTRGWR